MSFQQQGAATTVYCATARELEGVGGMYFNNCFQCSPHPSAMDTDLSKALWDLSDFMVTKARNKRKLQDEVL